MYTQITLADIVVASALVYPFKLAMDAEYRKPFACVARWFTTCVNQPQFRAVLGDVPLKKGSDAPAAKAEKAGAGAGKKEKKAAAPAAAAAAAPAANDAADLMDEAEKPQKKEKHPLAVLDTEQPTAFVLDDWKRNISNCNGDYAGAMQTFWSTLDQPGWSLWLSKYKYNDENKRMFMTCNAVSGFIQRTDALRKWAFGVMHITGEEGSAIEISGCWLLRGQSVEYMLAENPDAEYYDWVKLDLATQRSVVDDFWSKTDGMQLEGKTIFETKSFK